MRCFIAVDINDHKLLDNLNKVAMMLNLQGVKPVERENMHITLRFLGEISEKVVEEIIAKLKNVSYKEFQVRVFGLDAFPNTRWPRVVWAGIKEGHAELIQLQSIIENELQNLKLRLEREKFHPHITLARVKDRRSLSKVVEIINSYKEEEFGNFSVKDLVLKQSILRSSGPIYNDIMRFKL